MLPVPGPVVGGGAVEGLHSSQQTVTGGHGRRQADVFRVQGLVVVVFKLERVRKQEKYAWVQTIPTALLCIQLKPDTGKLNQCKTIIRPFHFSFFSPSLLSGHMPYIGHNMKPHFRTLYSTTLPRVHLSAG